MTRPPVPFPGDALLTKVGNGISALRVLRVEATQGRVHFEWSDGSLGSTTFAEIGNLGQTDRDYSYVLMRNPERGNNRG